MPRKREYLTNYLRKKVPTFTEGDSNLTTDEAYWMSHTLYVLTFQRLEPEILQKIGLDPKGAYNELAETAASRYVRTFAESYNHEADRLETWLGKISGRLAWDAISMLESTLKGPNDPLDETTLRSAINRYERIFNNQLQEPIIDHQDLLSRQQTGKFIINENNVTQIGHAQTLPGTTYRDLGRRLYKPFQNE